MRLALALLAGCSFSRELPAAVVDAAPDAGMCAAASKECVGEILRECPSAGMTAIDTSCNWGCTTLPEPRCSRLDPHGGGATAMDVNGDMLLDVTLDAGTTIDGDNGRIGTNVDPDLVRPMGPDIINGIDYQMRANNISVFRFKSLTIKASTAGDVPALFLTGTRAIVLVADGDITIEGVVDARGACVPPNPGPGGLFGGPKATAAQATRTGAGTADDREGGGGGGHADEGGDGRGGNEGGMMFGDEEITILAGGGGGGGGGGGANAGIGGGGGGALQLLANGKITIAEGAAINAGGCGGETGRGGNDGGGGGGAGGTILIEAKEVILDGTLAANGGGGGGGDVEPDGNEAPGQSGQLGMALALGFPGPNASGGDGGANTTLGGQAGGNQLDDGGGGGGAAGRIRINTKSGMPTRGQTAVLSPAPSTNATTFGPVRLD